MQFLDEDLYDAVKNYIPKVSEYVNSHGGGITLLGVKNGVVYITLTGACGGCSMSLMTTKMVVQRKLRELLHPALEVVNVDGSPENTIPDDLYTGPKEEAEKEQKEEQTTDEKHGMLDNIKHIVGL
jgi:Fe-S cluster biogenesis protein NfuA